MRPPTKSPSAWRLLQLLVSRPQEFSDRIGVLLQLEMERRSGKRGPQNYPSRIGLEDAVRTLSAARGRDLRGILGEADLHDIQSHVARVASELSERETLPFPLTYNADSTLARLTYLICRALEPETAIETGVAYGVTSAVILAALRKNGKGVLHSIDLPPLGDNPSHTLVGCMVPAGLRDGWRLHRGPSKRILPALLADRGLRVGVFVHDSADIYGIQRMELRAVWPRLAPPFAVVANGIHSNPAFPEFVREHAQSWYAIGQRENPGYLIGLILGG